MELTTPIARRGQALLDDTEGVGSHVPETIPPCLVQVNPMVADDKHEEPKMRYAFAYKQKNHNREILKANI